MESKKRRLLAATLAATALLMMEMNVTRAENVSNWADLKAGLEAGGNTTLTSNINLSGTPEQIAASQDAMLDLGNNVIDGSGITTNTANLIQATASDFIINGGTFQNVTRDASWGSILHLTSGGNLTVNDTKFFSNSSVTAGAISVGTAAGSIAFNNVTFEGNSAGEIGAVGLYKAASFNNVRFIDNEATNATGDGTGALFLGSVSSATLGGNTVTDSLFEGNTSAARAGAIGMRDFDLGDNSGATLDISNTTFRNNTAATNGGAIDNYFYNDANNDGYVKITDSAFTSNTAAKGGAIYNHRGGAIKVGGQDQVGKIYVADSTFTGNTATEQGGAIYNEGELTIGDNVSFIENGAVSGGAIYNTSAGRVVIGNDAVFRDNTAEYRNVGIYGGSDIKNYGYVEIGNGAQFTRTTYQDAINNDDVYDTGIFTMNGSETVVGNDALFKNIAQVFNNEANASHTIGNGATFEHNGSVITNFGGTYEIGNGATFKDSQFMTLANKGTGSSITVGEDALFEGNMNPVFHLGSGDWVYMEGNGAVANNSSANSTMTFGDGLVVRDNLSAGKGVIYNVATSTVNFNGSANFTGNTSEEGTIYNEGTVNFNGDATFSGNVNNAGGAVNDIYNKGTLVFSNTATDTTNAVSATISGDSAAKGTINKVGAGVVSFAGSAENQNINVNAGELHISTTATDGSNLVNSTVSVADGAIINTIDNVVNNYTDIITLNNGALIKGDVNYMDGTADTYSAVSGSTVKYSIANLIGDIGSENRTIQVVSDGSTVDINEAVFNTDKGLHFASSGSADGKMVITGVAGGINGAVETTDDNIPIDISYNVTANETFDYEADDADRTIQNSNFVINGNNKKIAAADGAKGIIVANDSVVTVNNTTFSEFDEDNKGAFENYGTLNINDSHFTADNTTAIYNHVGATLNSDPTTYNARVINDGTATFSGDSFENIATVGLNGGALYNTGTLTIQKEEVTDPTPETYYPTFIGNSSTGRGGAIYSTNTMSISDAIFGSTTDATLGNSANEGGAIFIDTGDKTILSTITNTLFANNTATTYGGAIDHRMGTVNITGSTFANNSAGEQGGAILERLQPANAFLNISDSTFTANEAVSDGGAISAFANLSITDTNFDANKVTGTTADGGGAILIGSDSITSITGNGTTKGIFSNNTSTTRGGAIATRDAAQGNNANGKLDITNVQFTGNSAATDGGAIYNAFHNNASNDGYVSITNSVFDTNSAARGGAIFNDGKDQGNVVGNISITDTTFTGNTASDKGGAIYSAGNLTINAVNAAVTFSGNTATTAGNDIFMQGVSATPVTLALNAANDTNKITITDIDGQYYNVDINNDNTSTGTVELGDLTNAGAVVVGAGTVTAAKIDADSLALNVGTVTSTSASTIDELNTLAGTTYTASANLTTLTGENKGTIDGTGTFIVGNGDTTSQTYTNSGLIKNNIEIKANDKLVTKGSNTGVASTTESGIIGTVSNAGSLELTGGTIIGNISGAGSTKIKTGTVTNISTISQAVNVASGTFNNTTGSVSGTTTIDSGATVSNAGTLGAVVNEGTFTLSDGTVTSILNKATTPQGVSQSGGAVTSVDNRGAYAISGGSITTSVVNGYVNDDPTLNVAGTLTISEADSTVPTSIALITNKSVGTVNQSAGTVTTVSNEGTYNLSGGTVTTASNTGTFNLTADGTVTNYSQTDGDLTISDGASMTLTGTTNTIGGGTITLGAATPTTDIGTLTINNGATNTAVITTHNASVLDIKSGSTFNTAPSSLIDEAAAVTIGGTLGVQSTGTVVKLNDNDHWNGSVAVSGGQLTLSGVTQNGNFSQVAGETVISAAQTIGKSGKTTSITGGTLTINDDLTVIGSATETTITSGDGNAKIVIASGETLDIQGGTVTLDGGDQVVSGVHNHDQVDWQGDVTLNGGKLILKNIYDSTRTSELGSNTANKTNGGRLLATTGDLEIDTSNVLLGTSDTIAEAVNLKLLGHMYVTGGADVELNSTDNLVSASIVDLNGGTLQLNGVTTSSTTGSATGSIQATSGTLNLTGSKTTLGNNSDFIAKAVKTSVGADLEINNTNGTGVTLNDIGTTGTDDDSWTKSITLANGNLILDNVVKTTSSSSKYIQNNGTLKLVNGSSLTLITDTNSAINGGSVELGSVASGSDPATVGSLILQNSSANIAEVVTKGSGDTLTVGDGTTAGATSLKLTNNSLINQAAALTVNDASTLEINSTKASTEGVVIDATNDTWAGKVALTGGTLTVLGDNNKTGYLDADTGYLNIGGTLGAGTLNLNYDDNTNKDDIASAVVVNIASNGVLNQTKGNVVLNTGDTWAGEVALGGGNLEINGLSVVTDGTIKYTQTAGALTIDNSGSLTLQDAESVITGDSVTLGSSTTIGTLIIDNGSANNKAVLTTNGHSVFEVASGSKFTTQTGTNVASEALVSIGGELDVQAGTVSLDNGTGSNDNWTGTVDVSKNGTLNLAGVTQSSAAVLTQNTAAGTGETGGTINVTADQSLNSHTQITQGNLNIQNSGTTLTLTGGTITSGDNNAKVTIASGTELDIQGGTVTLNGGDQEVSGVHNHNQVSWVGTVKLNGGTLVLKNIYDSTRTTEELGSNTANKSGVLNALSGILNIDPSNVLLGTGDNIDEAVALTLSGHMYITGGADVELNGNDTSPAPNTNDVLALGSVVELGAGGNLQLNGVTTSSTTGYIDAEAGSLNILGTTTLGNTSDVVKQNAAVTIASGNTLKIDGATVTLDSDTTTTPSTADTWAGGLELASGSLTMVGRDDATVAPTSSTKTYNQEGGTLTLNASKLKLATNHSKINGGNVNINNGSELTFDNGTAAANANAAVIKSDANTSNALTVGGTNGAKLTLTAGSTPATDSNINAKTAVTIKANGELTAYGDSIKGDGSQGITNDGVFNLSNNSDTAGTIARAINKSASTVTTGTVNLTGTTLSTAAGVINQAKLNVGNGTGAVGSSTFTMGANVTLSDTLKVFSDGKIVNAANNIVTEAIDVALNGSIVGSSGVGASEGNITVNNGGTNAGTISQSAVTLAGNLTNTGSLTANGTFANTGTIVDGATPSGKLNINGGGTSSGSITQNEVTVTGATAFNNNANLTATKSLINSGIVNNSSNIKVQDEVSTSATYKQANLKNTGLINSTSGSTITADTLTNHEGTTNGRIDLTKAKVAIVYQADDIKGIINVLGTDATVDKTDLSIKGTNPNFAGTMNIGSATDKATLNLQNGKLLEDAALSIASGSVLNVDDSGAVATQIASVVLDAANDTYAGDVTLASGAVTMKDLTLTTGDVSTTSTSYTGTNPYYAQTGGALTLTSTQLSMVDSSLISGGNLTVDTNSTFNSLANSFSVANLTNAGLINGINGGYENYAVSTGLYAGDNLGDEQGDFTTDLYARSNTNKNYDSYGSSGATIYASDTTTLHGTLNVSDWTLNGDIFGWDAPIDRKITMNNLFKGSVAAGHTIDFTSTNKEVFTPIGWYGLHNAGGGNYSFNLNRYNLGVFRGQVTTIAQYQNQLMIDDMLFNHTMLDQGFKGNDYIASNPNRLASANDLYPPYQYSRKDGGVWVKMYGTFERLNMNQGLDVGNNAYGTLIGVDFGLKDLKNGWQFMPTAYIGYHGAHQYWNGYGAYQNGGQLGVMGTWYKNNFMTGALLYGGVYGNEMNTPRGNDNAFNYFAGGSVKTAYNWRFAKDWSLQPNLMIAYNYFGQQNWHSDFGQMGMMSGMLNGINIAPGLNLIWEKETFSLYATLQYMYNINQASGGRAGNVDLPNIHMDRGYIQYGLGVNKKFTDRFSCFFQTVIRNVGRNGVGLQGGFQWKLGKVNRNERIEKGNVTPELKKTEITVKGEKVQ